MTNKANIQHFPALGGNFTDRKVICAQDKFLSLIWDSVAIANRPTYGALCFRRRNSSKFVQEFIALPGYSTAKELLAKYPRHDWDQYFCPNVFSKPDRRKQFALITGWGWCDVDEADPDVFDPHPSLIWETSPGRYQALWMWDRKHSPTIAETFSRALTYRHEGDKTVGPATNCCASRDQ